MKFSKSLFLAFAGLGLFACSNEDVTGNGGTNDESTRVTVTVNTDLLGTRSRTIDATTPITGLHGGQADVEISKILVKVTAGTVGEDNGEKEFDSLEALEQAENKAVFTGIRQPTKVEVFVNNGKSEDWTLASFYTEDKSNLGLKAPMYGFADKGNGLKQEEDGNYTATITPKHETALLEFSDIKHIDKDGCGFNSITLDGLFLNGVKLGEAQGAGTLKATDWISAQSGAPTFSTIGEDFKTVNGQWPISGNCYAYNIFPQETNLPVLTLCFSNISSDNIVGFVDGKGYATVKNYKINEVENLTPEQREALGIIVESGTATLTKFVEGYVYKFTQLYVADENIGGTINGGEDVSLTATVTITPWNIAAGTVEWN